MMLLGLRSLVTEYTMASSMNKACRLLLNIVKTHVMLYGRQQMSGCLIRMDLLLYSLQEKLKEKLITISLKKIVVEVPLISACLPNCPRTD